MKNNKNFDSELIARMSKMFNNEKKESCCCNDNTCDCGTEIPITFVGVDKEDKCKCEEQKCCGMDCTCETSRAENENVDLSADGEIFKKIWDNVDGDIYKKMWNKFFNPFNEEETNICEKENDDEEIEFDLDLEEDINVEEETNEELKTFVKNLCHEVEKDLAERNKGLSMKNISDIEIFSKVADDFLLDLRKNVDEDVFMSVVDEIANRILRKKKMKLVGDFEIYESNDEKKIQPLKDCLYFKSDSGTINVDDLLECKLTEKSATISFEPNKSFDTVFLYNNITSEQIDINNKSFKLIFWFDGTYQDNLDDKIANELYSDKNVWYDEENNRTCRIIRKFGFDGYEVDIIGNKITIYLKSIN